MCIANGAFKFLGKLLSFDVSDTVAGEKWKTVEDVVAAIDALLLTSHTIVDI